jgi:TP901 family phage tail tape measure protein
MPQIVGTAVVTIVADTTAFNATLAGLGAKTTAAMAPGTMGASALSTGLAGVSASIGGVAAKSTAMGKALGGFTLAAVAFGVLGGKAAYNFDTAMRRVGAITQATGKQFDELDALAQKLGRDTEYTAAEAADGMTKLALAGFNVNEIMRAIPGTLRLASAGGFDLATATGIAADTLRSFAMEVGEVGRVNDVLSKTMTKTNTNLSELAYGMKFVAPVAAASKISFEETTAALGGLANAGLKGTIGGTALRGAIVKLEKPTKMGAAVIEKLGIVTHDATGRLLPLENIIGQLEKTSFGTADAITLMGQRAGPGFLALVSQGSEALRVMTQRNKEAGQEVDVTSKALGFNKKQHDELRWAFLSSFDAVSGFKFNMDDTTAVLGAFIKRGASTVQAQEKLQQAMQATSNDAILPLIGATRKLDGTLVDSEGDVLSFQSVLRLLEGTGLTSAEALEIFGESGLALAEAMNLPAEEISKLSEKMANSGTAAEIAVKQMEGVKGGLKRFQSSLEGIAIVALGGKDGIINKMADAADAVALFFNKLMEESPGVLKAITGIIFALGGLGIAFRIFGSLTKGVAGLVKMFAWLAANPAFIGFVLLTAALIGAYKSSEAFRDALSKLFKQVKDVYKLITDLLKPVKELGDGVEDGGKKSSVMSDILKGLGDSIATLLGYVSKAIKKFQDWYDNLSPEELENFKETLQRVIDGIKLAAVVIGGIIATWGLLAFAIFAVSTALTILTSPILLVVAGIAALGFIFKAAYDNVEPFRNLVDGFVDNIQKFAQAFSDGTPVIEEGIEPIEKFGDAVRALFDNLAGLTLEPLIGAFKAVTAYLTGDVPGATKAADDTLKNFTENLKTLPESIGNVFSGAFSFTSNFADFGIQVTDDLFASITTALGDKKVATPLAEAIASAIKAALLLLGATADIGEGLINNDDKKTKEGTDKFAKGLLTAVTETVPGLTQATSDALGSVFPTAVTNAINELEKIPIAGDLAKLLLEPIKGLSQQAGGFADILTGIFTFDPEKLRSGLEGIGRGTATLVTETITAALNLIGNSFGELGNMGDYIYKNMNIEGIRDLPIVGEVAQLVAVTLAAVIGIVGNLSTALAGIFKLDPSMIYDGLQGVVKAIANWIFEFPAALLGVIADGGEALGGMLQGMGDYLIDHLPEFLDFMKDLPEQLLRLLQDTFGKDRDKGKAAGKKGGDDQNPIIGFFSGLFDSFLDWAEGEGPRIFARAFGDFVKRIPTILKDILVGAFKVVFVVLVAILTVLLDWVGDLAEFMGRELAGAFMSIGGLILKGLKNLGGIIFNGIKEVFLTLFGDLPKNIGLLLAAIANIPGMLVGALAGVGNFLFPWLKGAFDTLVTFMPVVLELLLNFFVGIPAKLIDLLLGLGQMLISALQFAFALVVEYGPAILSTLWGWVSSIPKMLIGLLAGLGQLLLTAVTLAFNWIATNGPGILAAVIGWVIGIPGQIIGALGAIGGTLFGWAKAGFDLVVQKGPELLAGLVSFFAGIPSKLIGALGDAAGGVGNFAAKIFNSLAGFINDKLVNKLRKISVFGAKPFEGIPTIPEIKLAQGGIITKATNAIVGEDGPEVVIPLSKPERAKELLVQSGLMDIISSGSPGIAMSSPSSTPDTDGISSTITTALSSVVDSAVSTLQPIKDWFSNLSIFAIESLKTFGETVWAGIKVTFQFLVLQILTLLQSLTAYIAAWPLTISGLLANTGSLIWLSMSSGMGAFAESFKAVFVDIGTFVTSWQASLTLGLGGLPGFMGGIAGQITAAITGPFVRFASGIWNPFAATLTGALDQIPATANINIPTLTFPTAHEGGVIGGRLPETGGPFDSSEMLVKMQRGEGVIPASVMKAMTPAEFDALRRGDFGERDPRADKAMAARFMPEMGAPASPMPPMGGESFDALPSSILEGLKDALKVTFAEAKNLTEQAFYAPKYLGGIASSAAMGGLGFVGKKITEANKAAADAIGGTGTAFPAGTPIGLPAAIERLRQVAGRPGNYRALIDYMTATQVPFRAVSMVRAGATTRGSGGARASLHASGRAVDFAGMRASRDSPELLRIYQAFQPVRDILQELIYSGPGGGFVRNPITRADHHDHVHAGLANGAIVSRRMTALLGESGPEVVIPLTRPMRALQLAEESGLMGVLSQAAGQRSATQGDTGVPLGGSAAGSVAVQGLFPGQGNTYNIYGISMAQVIAEIEAREQASTRVNFTRR